MKMVWIVIALMFSATVVRAANIDLAYENFYFDGERGRARVIVKITNNTASLLRMAIIECAFLNNDDRAIDTATLIATNIDAGDVAYADGWSSQMTGIEKTTCRVSSTH